MSQSNHSLIVSVQKLQDIENTLDFDNVTCSLFINSRPLGVLKPTDFHSPIPISNVVPNDTLQFIFYKNDHQELYGCISFTAKQFIDIKQENVQQWATLFEDPEDDIFDGKIGEEDEELPRTLLNVVVKKEEFLMHQEDDSQINFEAGLKDKVQEINLQQTLEFSSVACPRFDEHYQKSCDLSLISSHKILESPEKSQAQITAVHIEEIQMDLTATKCPFNLERKSSVGSHNPADNSIEDLMIQNPKREFGETHTTIGSTVIFDKQTSRGAESSRDHAKEHDCKLRTSGTLNNIKEDSQSGSLFLKQENIRLQERVHELEALLERLIREDAIKSENEELKFNTVKAELEVLKTEKDNCQRRLTEMETLLNAERELKIKFESLLKEKESETVRTENNNISNQELNTLKIQVQLDETVIQNLHKEIFSLRQKEDETLELNIRLMGASQTIGDYEEKINSLVEALGMLHIQKTESQSLEEFVAKVQEMLPIKAKEMEELKNTNEDLTIRLSICDNKLLADSLLAQIDDLKTHVASLEKERESMKEELHNANEKYMNLSNKYVELSDFFTGSKKPRQSEQTAPATRSSTPNLKRSTKPKPIQNEKNDAVDDIEAKLIEFTAFHKIQPFLLTRIEYGVYLYAGKKVYLKLQDEQLVVKVGDTYKPFQDFLKPKNSTKTNSSSTTTISSVSANKSNTTNAKNLKLMLKDVNKEERSFDQKTKARMSNYSSVQVDQSQRDLSSDLGTTSRSICKENARSLVRQLYQTSSTVMDIKNSSMKTLTRMDSNLKLKEILTSRMVDRRLSYGINQKRDKIQRDLTPL